MRCDAGEEGQESIGHKKIYQCRSVGNSLVKDTLTESNREPQVKNVWASDTHDSFLRNIMGGEIEGKRGKWKPRGSYIDTYLIVTHKNLGLGLEKRMDWTTNKNVSLHSTSAVYSCAIGFVFDMYNHQIGETCKRLRWRLMPN